MDIRKIIETDYHHANYKRTTDIASLGKKLITGEEQDELIIQFKQRETEQQKQQRVKLSHKRSSSVMSFVRDYFGRLERVEPSIKYTPVSDESEVVNKFGEIIDEFHGPMQKYLSEVIPDYNFLDPNAFIATTFDDFDPINEKPSPYPVIYESHEVVDFSFKGETCTRLVVKEGIEYEEGGQTKQGVKYTEYKANVNTVWTQVGENYLPFEDEIKVVIDGKFFAVADYQHTANYCPAIRLGYLKDPATKFKTCIPVWWSAKQEFQELINVGSQLDITRYLHTFLQKIQYAEPCAGENNMGCTAGKNLKGGTCGVCKGSGYKIHASGQDVLLFIKPKHKEDMVPLKDLVYYVEQPEKVLDHQDKTIDKLRDLIPSIVFSADQRVKYSETKNTATEVKVNSEKVNDKLFEMGSHLSEVFRMLSFIIGDFVDIPMRDVIHRYPADFRVKSETELLGERRLAVEAKAPSLIVSTIDEAIIQKKYEDNSYMRLKFEVMEYFRPFKSFDAQTIMLMMSDRNVSNDDKALYANFDRVFRELEEEMPEFYAMDRTRQKQLVYQKALELQPAAPEARPIFE